MLTLEFFRTNNSKKSRAHLLPKATLSSITQNSTGHKVIITSFKAHLLV